MKSMKRPKDMTPEDAGEGNDDPSSTLAWKTSWMEVPHSLQSMASERVRHD